MLKTKLGVTEYNRIYAALKLIENLFKQGLISQLVFENILDDYKECLDITEFKCYN